MPQALAGLSGSFLQVSESRNLVVTWGAWQGRNPGDDAKSTRARRLLFYAREKRCQAFPEGHGDAAETYSRGHEVASAQPALAWCRDGGPSPFAQNGLPGKGYPCEIF